MVKTNTSANIGFEKELWDAADSLRGHISAADYRKVIIGLIFLKYVSDSFTIKYNYLLKEDEGFEEDRDEYVSENIFFVPQKSRWDYIAENAHSPEIGIILDDAMREIESENKSLVGVLPKVYATPDLDKRVLGEVVDIFTNINMFAHGNEKDLLGRTYEYCLEQFAAYEGKNGGEFYTPTSIVKTIVEILKPFNGRVYDPACGSGGMFVQSETFVENHSGNINNLSIYGQEANADTWKMAKINMAIRGIEPNFGPHQADTFIDDLHPTLKADYIMANPPFNLKKWGADKLVDDVRWKYGTPPDSNANYAWIQHMIHHLAPNGKIGLVLANGSLSSTQSGEGDIRKAIIEDDLVEGIVALPAQLFYSVTIPACLWFISKNKKQKGKTVFIDARNLGHMVDRKHRDFTDDDIQKIAKTFEAFQEGTLENEKGFCAVVETKAIAEQDYILTPGRYIGIEDKEEDSEPFEEKMERLTTELSELFKQSHVLEEEIKQRLEEIGFEI
ncbi:putative type I restriction-modification system, M subunit [Streptococcus agalactiae ATCC 13813]|uniref:site-specific DNA-methyltransferase (adenine-specific) n=1 Tax=Streptococcus agalactiae TaxID=1311 RepID=A0A0H1UF31_STRAG|nr:class I SAM-dependent DNA methyltransferase [Streptococcus agalactiae]EFV96490.1 putative type I restriction-modification system, M subunit [Streptococcus agalactiae ATCC 13813]EGS28532.1 type I restriction-modification system DNA methylase [Streptococcus agalactiae FSL S3-026]EPT39842.1 DNA methyltransferase [Streptococcus agalactiae FSL S3-501]EPV87471.1 DNA methyltransferase [Streptococcus agalactiae FSL S3-586]EPV92053.1 DNA methyltransferase [Streptococcus agalactiae FSL S3-251]